MSRVFDLHVSTDRAALTAELRLADAAGSQLAWREVRLAEHPASRWEGLFDLRGYVERYAGNLHPLGEDEPLDEEDLLRELSVFLGREVLGAGDADEGRNLFAHLVREIPPRTLRVRLPASERATDDLTAAFARVPWEIARAGPEGPTLAEKNVLVRAFAGDREPAPEPLTLGPGEPLRVLLVFAAAPGSPPLAAQLERRRLLQVFHDRIYPRRRVEVDVLSHGVTRERLAAQIQDRGGYHVLHWSGHGFKNLLELYSGGAEPDHISGQELVHLFEEAGGYAPRLVFLGACYSGDLLRVRDWETFEAVVEGRTPGGTRAVAETAPAELPAPVAERPGYTGTAHALLEAGIPTVVAMRYAVGDDYARDLAAEFYDRLLADKAPKAADAALNQARRALLEAERRGAARYAACDHATPVFYGAPDPRLAPPQGSTPRPEVHPRLPAELRPHADFVGRSRELTRLGARWLAPDGARPVALVRGLGGLGKTALAAEAIGLWHEPFRWVFCFQAKPVALRLDEFLRQLHTSWMEQQGEYAAKVERYPAEAIWRPALEELTGERRQETLRENLMAALRAEPVLLVLDNFETCLVPRPGPGESGHACQDPGWDALLGALARGLVGSTSRLLVTSRWRPAALAGAASVEDLLLGPLPAGEAALYARSHPVLRRLALEGGVAGLALVRRLVHTSRGHPLLLDRLARLADRDPAALEAALGRLQEEGLARLPDVFAADPGDAAERSYLEDALAGSIDLLLERAGPEARRALWVLALANEPVAGSLWRGVWSGRDFEDEQLDRLRRFLAVQDQLPPEQRAQLPPIPEEMRARLVALDAQAAGVPSAVEFEALRGALVQIGLVTEERSSEADGNPDFTCHELVRERILVWMAEHPAETGRQTREQVWAAYGDRLASVFKSLVAGGQVAAALEAGVRALRYVVRAGAFEKLDEFTSRLLASTNDPRVLRVLLPELEQAVAAAPRGEARWSARTYLADALHGGGQPDLSLSHYAAAAGEAHEAKDWNDLAWITGNWANALGDCGQLEASQDKHRESARWGERAGRPAVSVLGNELEALRIDVMLGRAAQVLPEIVQSVDRVRVWWEATRRGETVSEAPDGELLGRVLVGALDIAREAHLALEQWEPALARIAEITQVGRARGASEHEIAINRFNRHWPLIRLGRLGEAQHELVHCLEIFERAGDETRRAMVLSALADLSGERGDLPQAIALARRALAIHNTLPHPADRAISHGNLCNYLARAGKLPEATAHEAAALVYLSATGHRQLLLTSTHNHALRLHRARQAGQEHTLPRLADLLTRPDFAPLRDWLTAGQANLDQLQEAVDAFVAQCRETAGRVEPEGTA